jgi:murein DD-endopeptidase MepM/ murein hydrolase activator NlpD
MKTKLVVIILIAILLLAAVTAWIYDKQEPKAPTQMACTEEAKVCADGSVVVRSGPQCLFAACPGGVATSSLELPEVGESQLAWPLANALTRVTKKPFGIKISPTKSPVSPERFNGYHTGVDLEVKEGEESAKVPVLALCAGKVKLKQWVSGYGGVLITSCQLDGEAVTVIYGHLDLDSIKYKVGDELSAGSLIGDLGKGYSSETDQERKHLHLAIHRGTATVLAGYVATEGQLKAWLDPMKYLTKVANGLK